MVEGRTGQHEPVHQGYGQADAVALDGAAQRVVGRRTVQVDDIANADVRGRYDDRLAIRAKPEMTHEPFVEDGLYRRPIIPGPFGEAPDTNPRAWACAVVTQRGAHFVEANRDLFGPPAYIRQVRWGPSLAHEGQPGSVVVPNYGKRPLVGISRPGAFSYLPVVANRRFTEGRLSRRQVQRYYLVRARAGAVVGARRLTGLVGVALRGPTDEMLRVVLEPLRSRGHRDDRQLGGHVLGQRGQSGCLCSQSGCGGQLGQLGIDGRVVDALVVTGGVVAGGE